MDASSQVGYRGFRSVSTQGNMSHVDLPLFRYELFERDLQKLLNVFLDDFTECQGAASDQPNRRVQLFLSLMCNRRLYDDITSFTTKHKGTILGMVHKCVYEMGKVEEVRGLVFGTMPYSPGQHPSLESSITTMRCGIMVQLCGALGFLLPELYDAIEPMLAMAVPGC